MYENPIYTYFCLFLQEQEVSNKRLTAHVVTSFLALSEKIACVLWDMEGFIFSRALSPLFTKFDFTLNVFGYFLPLILIVFIVIRCLESTDAGSTFSNIIEGHTKATLSMRQVQDHVRPGLTRRVPNICVLLSSPFQERVSNFAVNVLQTR
jgi:hypothetical protein